MSATITIIICTRNRADSLAQTLQAMADVCVPEDWHCELIVVDNGSTDGTESVVRACCLPQMPVHYLRELQMGQTRARNTGIAAAGGDIILFTDDDVRPPHNWLILMCTPILENRADAVAGGIRMAPHLRRTWMTPTHRIYLACMENQTSDASEWKTETLIGANMGFSKSVLDKVPGFDTELGPGALGFADDILFAMQLCKADYRSVFVPAATVEHHFDPSRLRYIEFLSRMEKEGRSAAYLEHHWQHMRIRYPHLRLIQHKCKLFFWRLFRSGMWKHSEGCPDWEMQIVKNLARYQQYLAERRRTPAYQKHGFAKQVTE